MLIVAYSLVATFLPPLAPSGILALHFAHALAWCLFHSFGLGLVLRAQSERKYLVRHFLKHYHYPRNDNGAGAVYEAFANWKSMYNLSMCMTYGKRTSNMLAEVPSTRHFCSVLYRPSVEDVLDTARLDGRQRAPATHAWRRECLRPADPACTLSATPDPHRHPHMGDNGVLRRSGPVR